MSFRLRKSVNLGGGVRLNLSKTGVGVSAGVPGARYSVHSSGRTTRTVGLPGSGMYFREDSYAKKGSHPKPGGRTGAQGTSPSSMPPIYPKAGLLAPRGEKQFVQGVTAFMQGRNEEALAHFVESSNRDTSQRHIGEEFFAGMCLVNLERNEEAIPYLEAVMGSDEQIPDSMMSKYHVGGEMAVNVTPALSVRLPMTNLAVALILAEVYQHTGKRQKAIDLLESLGSIAPNDAAFALSLADLYDEAEQYQEVVRVTEGFDTNSDDVTLQAILFRARALLEVDMPEGSLALTKEALKSKRRQEALLLTARYLRGLAYDKQGKAGMARKEFEKVFARDASFADVGERLG